MGEAAGWIPLQHRLPKEKERVRFLFGEQVVLGFWLLKLDSTGAEVEIFGITTRNEAAKIFEPRPMAWRPA